MFGLSLSAASTIFNEIYWLMAASLYDRNIRLVTTDEEWQNGICSFLRNYEFSCVGACTVSMPILTVSFLKKDSQ